MYAIIRLTVIKVKAMENNLITFNSMTPVMRSRDVLIQNGISSKIVRTPAQLRKKSCGYSLLVKKELDRALDIIKGANIHYIGTSAVDYL